MPSPNSLTGIDRRKKLVADTAGSSDVGIERITETGVLRITETGDIRITES